ncbi:hypothetical protein SNEBB_007862 [Seison nebaliae]|nr:hypothetical protein SNEBB_007862 [Seison nebaliae]
MATNEREHFEKQREQFKQIIWHYEGRLQSLNDRVKEYEKKEDEWMGQKESLEISILEFSRFFAHIFIPKTHKTYKFYKLFIDGLLNKFTSKEKVTEPIERKTIQFTGNLKKVIQYQKKKTHRRSFSMDTSKQHKSFTLTTSNKPITIAIEGDDEEEEEEEDNIFLIEDTENQRQRFLENQPILLKECLKKFEECSENDEIKSKLLSEMENLARLRRSWQQTLDTFLWNENRHVNEILYLRKLLTKEQEDQLREDDSKDLLSQENDVKFDRIYETQIKVPFLPIENENGTLHLMLPSWLNGKLVLDEKAFFLLLEKVEKFVLPFHNRFVSREEWRSVNEQLKKCNDDNDTYRLELLELEVIRDRLIQDLNNSNEVNMNELKSFKESYENLSKQVQQLQIEKNNLKTILKEEVNLIQTYAELLQSNSLPSFQDQDSSLENKKEGMKNEEVMIKKYEVDNQQHYYQKNMISKREHNLIVENLQMELNRLRKENDIYQKQINYLSTSSNISTSD